MPTSFLGNIKLSETGVTVQKYTVTLTTGASPTAQAALVFDTTKQAVPEVLSLEILDTDGSLGGLVSRIYTSDRTVSGLNLNLVGLYDGAGPVDIGVHTFTVEVLLRVKN